MLLKNGLKFDPACGFVRADVAWQGEKIATPLASDTNVYDVSGCYIIPGLTDIHFHGCRGADFSDGDAAGLATIAEYELSCGVTQICPTGMTLAAEQLKKICRTAREHREANRPGATIVGINLEGPFLSPAKKGAQNAAWLQEPNISLLHELETVSGHLVKLVSIAPELPGAVDFIREAAKTVTVSIAHTMANYEQASAGMEAGAKSLTHLFNAMPPLAHRDPGVIGAALDHAEVRTEIISDGIHVHQSAIRAAFKMFGAERMILVSDTMRAAGMPDGDYTLGGQDVIVKGKLATLKDGTIAGSVTNLMDCMRTAISFGINPADAVKAAAVNSAKTVGIYDLYGSLDLGKMANIVVLSPDFSVKSVIKHGQIVKGSL
ncbi:N-acetylglucosamine-6-phosphate deacetylase [Mageeibacillus indolicus]|uniref:N-acetylglucosamine-6-phosphate deacetylase n=1 Tax=Mageeibacillus indolicus (strain UPII9-5) TaxID=699246 RepID=D3R0X7_MAGIU|nr:N-acetylglucosamine-6-phosphate deacetylase [Mageeibacillus indolicus]ADC91758.1 N-acetylglucosamine-6-phosphate deacetylase [Mageeibacillus indolicus UPII9-5]KFA57767.1 N-acetylglucosamine-6-phosphate deacetylase [Mageeibacillus indolicus 0009-5]